MQRLRLLVNKPYLTAALLLICHTPLMAQEGQSTAPSDTTPAESAPEDTAPAEPTPADTAPAESIPADAAPADTAPADIGKTAVAAVGLSELLDMLKKQQAQLDAQKQQLVVQQGLIATLQDQASTDLTEEKDKNAKQAQQIEEQRQTMASMQTQIDQINQKKSEEMSEEDVELRSRLETLESSIQASQDAASTTFDEDSFPNSTMIPGTSAAMRMGGFVKMNIVNSFNPLGTDDRFIAGSIPVPQQTDTSRTTLTVSQSRLNYDLRDKTKFGTMRAYIEGDFAGDGDTFRLRHAYGQFKEVLAGKTWSVFQDTDASPEELDFEGINGAVNVRQAQIRYFPKIGHNWNMMVSVEDPNPEVTGGEATSRWPDLIASVRRTWLDRWHIRSSLVVRQISATWDGDTTGATEGQVTGWGLSLSGKTDTQFWNADGLDSIMFQFNVGEGIGRYVNDLNTVGGEDAIFDSTGNLEALPVFAGYVAYQHWWNQAARSNINLSWVNVDNLSFEEDAAYHETFRGALNYIWSPTPRIDLGMEFIYGKRENKNGEAATASQLQLSTKYRF